MEAGKRKPAARRKQPSQRKNREKLPPVKNVQLIPALLEHHQASSTSSHSSGNSGSVSTLDPVVTWSTPIFPYSVLHFAGTQRPQEHHHARSVQAIPVTILHTTMRPAGQTAAPLPPLVGCTADASYPAGSGQPHPTVYKIDFNQLLRGNLPDFCRSLGAAAASQAPPNRQSRQNRQQKAPAVQVPRPQPKFSIFRSVELMAQSSCSASAEAVHRPLPVSPTSGKQRM